MKSLVVIVIMNVVISLSINAYGQKAMSRSLSEVEETTITTAKVGAFGEVINIQKEEDRSSVNEEATTVEKVEEEKKTSTPPKSKAVYFHTAKNISKETGYLIELVISKEVLDKEHKIYQEFGNLMVQEDKNLDYCYLIGTFVTKEAAEKFLKGVILNRYPNAKVIELKNGNRK